jgi:hypothetical protein
LSDASSTLPQSLLDIADDDDLRCTICKRTSGRREGAKYIDDYRHPNGAFGASDQAINSNILAHYLTNSVLRKSIACGTCYVTVICQFVTDREQTS